MAEVLFDTLHVAQNSGFECKVRARWTWQSAGKIRTAQQITYQDLMSRPFVIVKDDLYHGHKQVLVENVRESCELH